jgi:hypothetical protein
MKTIRKCNNCDYQTYMDNDLMKHLSCKHCRKGKLEVITIGFDVGGKNDNKRK